MSEQAFRIINEPLTFQDHVYIQLVVALVRTVKEGSKRSITCDIQAAWDLSKAAADWREQMNKER